MTLVAEYLAARREEDAARLRRVLALRAMVAAGMPQRQIAAALGISQPAVSQQLRFAPELAEVHPADLLNAATPILKVLAADRGYQRLAVFGSVARGTARPGSDIDLIVEAPEGTSSFGFLQFKQLIEQVLGREIDLVEYGGLKPNLDDDIRREMVPL
ncbi:nucleotidyltransferase domain-containing protein [Mycolicibacterium diernhoferi]|uniref:Cro/Cl family transcriptional regulator n=1 Tax=Mycolicibacterium diernhoferi TaxID=1801 RepID=A0A2A7NMI5_9MYCO|nr:nucleotidyltransferase domain-containing protein [Mycolicibacterium diernhoferi]PEG51752.1 Cro/Cl family transcriptional regulator [Mycolicibacterium diernhoferi]QYL24441.1 nucleotidyltransferase domain-containing protein [Mycolicibacterium diernhoferi]